MSRDEINIVFGVGFSATWPNIPSLWYSTRTLLMTSGLRAVIAPTSSVYAALMLYVSSWQ